MTTDTPSRQSVEYKDILHFHIRSMFGADVMQTAVSPGPCLVQTSDYHLELERNMA